MKPTELSGTFGSMDSFLFQGTQHTASIPFPASVNGQRAAPFFARLKASTSFFVKLIIVSIEGTLTTLGRSLARIVFQHGHALARAKR